MQPQEIWPWPKNTARSTGSLWTYWISWWRCWERSRVRPGAFKEILEAGLSEAKVGVIPPAADQVLVGDMERTRLKDIKVLFFVGVNEERYQRKRTEARSFPI